MRCVNVRGLRDCQEAFGATNQKALDESKTEAEKGAAERDAKLEKKNKRRLKNKEGELREAAKVDAAAAKPEGDAAPAAEPEEGAEGGGEEDGAAAEPEAVRLTGALPEDHPKFADMEAEK